MSYKLGIDVGGTFTDLLLFEESTQKITLTKVPTTVENQAIGIVNGIEKICSLANIKPAQIDLIIHGTTAATNAVLEGKGVPSALIVTKGFRDVLHIMRQDRPKLYDFFAKRPKPLIPRYLRLEVPERTLFDGTVQKELNEEDLDEAVKVIKSNKLKSVAVCLLHSYVNPENERKVRSILQSRCPETHISLSSEILPEIKEYERMSTTAINASVYPIIDTYFSNLTERLESIGIDKTVHVMQSNGGIMTSTESKKKSVSTILSGPAAGTIGGVGLAIQAGSENVITVDMGGTSFDICLADKGKPKFTHECEIGGHALKVPMIDIHTIGAGGGSIAWIDKGGSLRVGPESAGAVPGPVCYGRGGKEPTVTDANLVLGRLNTNYFLGGEMDVDLESAREAIRKKLADPLGLSIEEVAEGIVKIVNAAMVKGIRYVSVEKGYDPREFAMVCFGGNGPVHAVELAEELDINELVVPFAPGVNSAYGLLMADFRYDFTKTTIMKISNFDCGRVNKLYSELEAKAREHMLKSGILEKDIEIKRTIDVRYLGQGYELEVSVPNGEINKQTVETIENDFHENHVRFYGFKKDNGETEIINVRIACFGRMSKPELKAEPKRKSFSKEGLKENRKVYLKGKLMDTAIYDRDLLQPGDIIQGPAIIEQKDSTTLIFSGNRAEIDPYRNILIRIKGTL